MQNIYVVSGTSRGIGAELARHVLETGHILHALARNPSESSALQKLKSSHGERLQLHAVDVTDPQSVEKFVHTFGNHPVDVLINNAGIYGDDDDFEELSLEKVADVFATNTLGPMRLTQALLPALLKSSLPRVAHITSQMGSIADNTSGGSYAYRISKAALNMFEKSFSIDYPKVISVVLHPGWVQTDMGGKAAPTSPSESASGILKVIAELDPKNSGGFFDFEGDSLPW